MTRRFVVDWGWVIVLIIIALFPRHHDDNAPLVPPKPQPVFVTIQADQQALHNHHVQYEIGTSANRMTSYELSPLVSARIHRFKDKTPVYLGLPSGWNSKADLDTSGGTV